MSRLGLLDVGPIEILVIAVAAIMLFGGDLPDIARRAGQFVGRLRSAAQDLTRQMDAPPDLMSLPEPHDALHRPPPQPPPQQQQPTASAAPPPPTSSLLPPEQPPPPPT